MNMDQKCNRGEVEFGINYENDMYGDVSVLLLCAPFEYYAAFVYE